MPCATLSEDGEAEIVKLPAAVAGLKAAIMSVQLSVPQT